MDNIRDISGLVSPTSTTYKHYIFDLTQFWDFIYTHYIVPLKNYLKVIYQKNFIKR